VAYDPLCLHTLFNNHFSTREYSVQDYFQQESFNVFTNSKVKEEATVPLNHISPNGILVVHSTQDQRSTRFLKVLFEPGSDSAFIHSRALPKGAVQTMLPRTNQGSTLAGQFSTQQYVRVKDGA
jgi:hypothetical protein